MSVKIAHISDVHWESRDDDVSIHLGNALLREKPDFLVFTGDLVDNPWKIPAGKKWLLELCQRAGLKAETQLLVVRGNHDIRILGNFGFRPLTGLIFRRAFREWMKTRVQAFPEHSLVFLRIDSNPVMWGFARGHVGWWEARKLRQELSRLAKKLSGKEGAAQLEEYTKIALVHHHVLPMPYEGGDRFLLLKDAQRLLQLLAEKKVDVVLHGHKHRAPYSLVTLGTCGGGDRVMEILGAGATVKKTDHDPRGHNFNLLCIEDTGLRYVRQFFAPPGEDFRESFNLGFVSHAIEHVHRRALQQGYRYKSIRWVMVIDVEGDRFNQLSYDGLMVTEPAVSLREITPPPYKVATGHLSEVRLNEAACTPGITLKISPHSLREMAFRIHLPDTPTADKPMRFTLESYDFNGSALNAEELKKKFPKRLTAMEWDEKLIRVPVDEFSWVIRFPEEMKFNEGRLPEFEVLDDAKQKHDWLTRALQPCFHYSQAVHSAVLAIHKPPVGYQYRIKWYVPEGAKIPKAAPGPEVAKSMQFADMLLESLNMRKPEEELPELIAKAKRVLEEFLAEVVKHLAAKLNDKVNARELDVSYMMYDEGTGEEPAQLRVVACAGKFSGSFWSFSLEVGDGNAGRAFKSGVVRWYDRSKEDFKDQAYVGISGQLPHEFLCSIPFKVDAPASMDFGVLNIGTFSPIQASQLKSLKKDSEMKWLMQQAYERVLDKLLKICDISFEAEAALPPKEQG